MHLRITPTHAPNHLTSKFVRWVDVLTNKEHEVGRCVVLPDDLQGREFVGMKILDTSPSRVGFQLPPQVGDGADQSSVRDHGPVRQVTLFLDIKVEK